MNFAGKHRVLLRTILAALLVGGAGFLVAAAILSPIFAGRVILPQYWSIAGLNLQFYGTIIAAAAGTGYWLALKRQKLLNSDSAETIIFWAVVGGFVGARLYHVVSELGYYWARPAQIPAIWNGGLSIYGAGLGGLLAVYLYWKYRKGAAGASMLSILDWLTPSVIIGQIIGRFGNFLNYELYGLPTQLPWKMFVPVQFRMPPFEMNQFFHPLFLYEAAGSAVILVLVLKLKLRTGSLFLMWVFLYNVMRFFLEFMRVDSVVYGGIRVNAVLSLALAGIAAFVWHQLKSSQNAV